MDRIIGTLPRRPWSALGSSRSAKMSDGHRWKGDRRRAKVVPKEWNSSALYIRSARQTIGPVHCRVRGHRSEGMFPVLAVGIAHGGRLSKMQSWRTCFSGCALRNRIALYRRSRSTCFRALLPASSGLPASCVPADCLRRSASASRSRSSLPSPSAAPLAALSVAAQNAESRTSCKIWRRWTLERKRRDPLAKGRGPRRRAPNRTPNFGQVKYYDEVRKI